MKKKYRATADYLVAEDKSLREQLEFIKTQGRFFEKVMASLEEQVQKHRFVIRHYYQLAVQLHKFYLGNTVEEAVPHLREWPIFSSLKEVKQPMTQDQIRDACDAIIEDSVSDDPDVIPEYVIVDFAAGRLTWDEQSFILSHSVIDIEVTSLAPLGDRRDCCDLPLGDRLNGTVYIRDRDGLVQAFLKANGDDGKEHYFELTHFSILFLLDEDRKNPGSQEQEPETGDCQDTEAESQVEASVKEDARNDGSTHNGKVGMFTLFDKLTNLLFVTTY